MRDVGRPVIPGYASGKERVSVGRRDEKYARNSRID